MKPHEEIVMKAIALCFKEWLKPEEAHIYTNLAASTLLEKCQTYGISKNKNGYYSRKDLDLIVSGGPTKYEIAASKIKIEVGSNQTKK